MHTYDRAVKQQELSQKMKVQVRSVQVMLHLLVRSNEIKVANAELGLVPVMMFTC